MDTQHGVPSDRPGNVAITSIWNSFGVLDAVAAFGVVYVVMRVVGTVMRRLRPSPH